MKDAVVHLLGGTVALLAIVGYLLAILVAATIGWAVIAVLVELLFH